MSWSEALRGYSRYIEPGGMRKPAPSHFTGDAANRQAVKLVSAQSRIAGKELEPQPSGNEREANSDGRKEAMCAVVQSIVIIAQR